MNAAVPAASCTGLAGGWALKAQEQQPVYAYQASPSDGPFVCPTCRGEAILRKGITRVDHFAHDAPRQASPSPETALHRRCKQQVCAALAAAIPQGRWAIERPIPSRPELRIPLLRPDLSGRVGDCRVAVEVQASSLHLDTIAGRTLAYARRGIHVVWVVPLAEEPIEPLTRPRLYERCFQDMFGGRTYYWWPGLGASVLPVHYGVAHREIPASEWHAPGGARRRAGGFEVPYRAIKQAHFGPLLRIDRDFEPLARAAPGGRQQWRLWVDRAAPWW